MSRRPKRKLDNNGSWMNSNTYISIGIIVLAVIAFVLAYTMYGRRLSNQSDITNVEKIANTQSSKLLNVVVNNDVSETSSSIGKSINEVENLISEENDVEKRAVNTSEVEKDVVQSRENNSSSFTEKKEELNNAENTTVVDPTFIKPVDGEIIKDYSSDNLLYSTTLEEWTTHLGIDFAAEKTSIVKTSAEGTIKSIKNDPRYGLTIVIEHSNGFSSMYANLLSTEFVTVGDTVKQGDTIGTVGNTATFEIADETHLHFEILKEGINVDPNLYLK